MTDNRDFTPKDLADALRAHLSPHTVALITAKLQVSYASPGKPPSVAMVDAEQQCQWFTALLLEMIGSPGTPGSGQYNALCDELGL